MLGIEKEHFDHVVDEAKAEARRRDRSRAERRPLERRDRAVQRRSSSATRNAPFPQDVDEQLELAIGAVFDSWNSKRAIDYRKLNKIPDDWGTAVSVVSMVFGNMGDDSGTGVAFTRDPNTGEKSSSASTCATRRAKTSSPGSARPRRSPTCRRSQPDVYAQFVAIAHQLETHYNDMQDLEFTVERGKLYMLQTRSGKRSAEAAVKIALDFVHEGSSPRTKRLRGSTPPRSTSSSTRASIPTRSTPSPAKGSTPRRAPRPAEIVFDADTAASAGKARRRR